MYITKTHDYSNIKITLEQPKARAQWLNEVMSGRKGGRMQDKRKSRARQKQAEHQTDQTDQ